MKHNITDRISNLEKVRLENQKSIFINIGYIFFRNNI